ncbi:hypothetical protein BH09ACT10_BH09ACT10_04290 [soil metagenome]
MSHHTDVLRLVRRISGVGLTILVFEYLVLPKLLVARDDVSLLSSVAPAMLAIALFLQIASLAAYSGLTWRALHAGPACSFATLLRVDLTGLGVSHVVPGGGATAAALRFRLLTEVGVRPLNAMAGTAVQTGCSVVSLVAVFLCGLAFALPQLSNQHLFLQVGVGSLLSLAIVGVLMAAVLRYPEASLRIWRRLARKIPFVRTDAPDAFAKSIATLTRDKRSLLQAMAWALANWLLDAACLWICLRAYDFSVPLAPLLAIYGVANLLAFIPLAPGGLGVVEGVLIPALVALGAAHSIALLGVLTWRFFQFLLPIPVAGFAFASLRWDPYRRLRASTSSPAQNVPHLRD